MENALPISFESNDAFREIFQSMSEGILMVDEAGKIITANAVAEHLFGYEKNEMSGMQLEQLLPERYRGRHMSFRREFNEHPEPRRMGIGRDLTALRKDSREFPVEISLSYTRLKGKLYVMAFISDITLRKKSEDALRRSEEQLIVYAVELEKKVESRTQALNGMVEALEKEVQDRKRAEEDAHHALGKERELNELKSKFVSIASHEFRTPLSAILSSASLMQQYSEKQDQEKVHKHVQRIKTSVKHLTSILDDLLSLGRLEEGKIEMSRERIELSPFVQEVKEEISSVLKEQQQILVLCPPAAQPIYSDARILRHILFNLISNASKYSDIGKRIFIECNRYSDRVSFSVRDEGIGIPKDEQRHLFDRFFRASNAGQVQGTGLGLNIVKRYAELIGGSISFTSEAGTGSIFTLVIPDTYEENSVN
jgi:PAS domain S-box-containing protein